MTFTEAVEQISRASGRPIAYVQITSDEFASGLEEQQVPGDYIWLLNYLFNEVLDVRNECLTDGAQPALGASAS